MKTIVKNEEIVTRLKERIKIIDNPKLQGSFNSWEIESLQKILGEEK